MQNQINFEESNEHYLALRLQFKEDQPRSWRAYASVGGAEMLGALAGAWARGAIFATLVTPFALFVLLLAGTSGIPIALLLWLAAWGFPWFLKDYVYAGHWELSLENQGELVEPAFALTALRLSEKGTTATIAPKAERPSIVGSKRYYLTVKQDSYTAYIALLSYGTDLFVSWSMWREQRPLPTVWKWAIGMIESLFGKGSQYHDIVQADPARAMREAVHNSVRAGVEAAVEGQQATNVGTFGMELTEHTNQIFTTLQPTIDLSRQQQYSVDPSLPQSPRPTDPPAGPQPSGFDVELNVESLDGPGDANGQP